MSPIQILILTANPSNTGVDQLDLDAEVEQIKEAFQRSLHRDRFQVITKLATRPTDLRQALLEYRPQIVHFSGHGTETQGLVLENDQGKVQLVSTEALGRLFGAFDDSPIECVLLNACYSEVQAAAIHQFVDCVIGMKQPIGDQSAIQFSQGFYDALGAGSTYAEAFNMGCSAIDLEGSAEYLTPQLIGGKGGRAISPVGQGRQAPEPTATDEGTVRPAQSQSIGNVTISGSNNPFNAVQSGGNATVSQNNSRQSLNISGGTISGQVGLAGGDLTQTQYQNPGEAAKLLSPTEVVQLITQIESLLGRSGLPEAQQSKVVTYLEAAKEEANSKEPDKDFAAKSLQKATQVLKDTNEVVDAGQSLWGKVAPLLKQLLPWLGVASHFFGL